MDVFKTLILDTPTVEGANGTVTSVDLTAGTGISVSGGPITSSGSINVTNTAPDQTVALTGGTGISTSGTYPNFTITNSAPDQTVSIASGTGISVTGTYPSFTVTNSSPSLGGDVVGPASATDNAVVRFDSTTGKLIQDSGVSISDANLLTTTALTVNDNTTLGSSNTDTVTFNARSASEFTPATDNTYDLGRTGHEWRDLYINGTANIDSLIADTADVNGGTIDGTTIGVTTPSTGAFTTLSATTSALVNHSGVAAPTPVVTNALQLVGNTSESTNLEIDTFAATPFIYGVRREGTPASPTATQSGNNLLAISGRGYGTTTISGDSARILFQAAENFTDSAHGSRILLQATATGSTSVGTIATVDATGLAVTGDISDSKGEIRLIPQNSQSAAYTLVASDSGKHILHPSADTTARTFTIPANASVAFPIGTAVTFVNQDSAGVVTIAITSDTMRLAGAGTTGSRTLAANGVATAIKITSTEWIISGNGLT